MLEMLHREAVYLWYYFSLQLSQIFCYWVQGWVLGSTISVFAKEYINGFSAPASQDTDPNILMRFLKNLGRNIKATGPMFLLGVALSALFQR